MAYQIVLVGTDGSESSYRAVDRATEVALGTDATLVLACAYQPIPERVRREASEALGDEAYKVTGSHPADDVLNDASGRARAAGLAAGRLKTVSALGDPVDVLLELAERERADLVVVGNRGLNSLAGRILGSVPANISHKAGCDVLIVHTTRRGR